MLQDSLSQLRSKLPPGWLVQSGSDSPSKKNPPCVRVCAPDHREALLMLLFRRSLFPRDVRELSFQLQKSLAPAHPLITAPYLSPQARSQLASEGLNFLDFTGNMRLIMDSPGLFIWTQGADEDPLHEEKEKDSRTLRGAKAGRVVRSLIDSKEPHGVREIAALTGVNAGYVSRVLSLLEHEGFVERRGRKQPVLVDWPRLLRHWAAEVPLAQRGQQTTALDPRGISALMARLKQGVGVRYAITGSVAAARLAPLTPSRLVTLYVEDEAAALADLGLRKTDAGANVLLITPHDEGVWAGSRLDDGLHVVSASQTAIDLLTSPGRAPAEADALIVWMQAHEELWRG